MGRAAGWFLAGLLIFVLAWLLHDCDERGPSSVTVPAEPGSTPVLIGPGRTADAPDSVAPEPAADSAEILEVHVHDLGTEERVPDLTFALVERQGMKVSSGPWTADADGRLIVPAAALRWLRCATEGWTLARPRADEVRASRRLWVHTRQRIEVTIRVDPGEREPIDFSTVRVHVDPSFDLMGGPEDGLTPFTQAWANARPSLHMRPVAVDARGVASFEAPRVRTMRARARAPGWIGQSRVFSATSRPDATVRVEIELRRYARVRGRLLGRDGKPVAGADVRVHVRRYLPDYATYEKQLDDLFIPGLPLMAHTRKDGTAVLNYAMRTTTDEDGAYELDVLPEGAITLVAHGRGHAPLRTSLGAPSEDVVFDATLDAPTHDVEHVAITFQGRPVAAQSAQLIDFVDLDQQTVMPIAVDAQGRIRASWLIVGRPYRLAINVGPTRGGLFTWNGESTIEIEDLVHQLDVFLGLRPK